VANTSFCPQCGAPVGAAGNGQGGQQQQSYVYESYDAPVRRHNGIGVAGFVLSLIGLIFCWVPVFNFFLVIPGLIMSIVGACRKPRGLSVAGIILACVAIIVFIILLTSVRDYQRAFF